jgi:two-component system sensor histidine kinase/response regulator
MDSPAPIPVLDRAEGLRRVGGDEKLYREMAELFLADAPRLTQLISAAIAGRSPKGLRLAAHSLKGSASQVGATAAVERAWLLEKMGKENDFREAEHHLHLLTEELRQLSLALHAAI